MAESPLPNTVVVVSSGVAVNENVETAVVVRENVVRVVRVASLSAAVVTDHGALTGLGDDDHPQYAEIAAVETISALWTFSTHPAGLDHASLANIGTNPHVTIDAHIADATIHFTEASIDHTAISNIGVNSHAAIDTHIADATIHFTEASIDHTAISNIGTNSHAAIDTHIGDATIHFTEASIDHTAIANIGTNSHAAIDTHIADATIHFTEAGIDHTAISNIGTNSHAAIDTHIGDATIHFTEASIDHGSIAGLADDDHPQYLLLLGRAGGQTAAGGTVVGNNLVLEGSTAAGGGRVHVDAPLESLYSEGNTTPAEQIAYRWRPTFTTLGAYIGGWLENSATITYTNSFYIYASLLDRSTHISNAPAGFQAFTLFNALPTITQGTNDALVQMIILNDGGVHSRTTSGTSTTIQHVTVSSVPHIRANVSGAVMTWSTGATGLSFAPKFTTVAGSTINMGTVSAVESIAPAVALFSTQGGVENITNIYGHWFRPHTNVVAGEINVVRNEMAPAANRYLIRSTTSLQSNFGGGTLFNIGITQHLGDGIGFSSSYGAAGGDMTTYWDGASYIFNPLAGDNLVLTLGTNLQSFNTSSASEDAAINFIHPKGAFGEGGAPGNNKYRFVAQAETVTIGGEFTQFLLTQAANDTIDAALSLYAGWTINAPTPTLGTGSITTTAGLNVGGNPSVGTNRVGLRIISNPTGGGGVNAALWVTAGLTQLDGDFGHTGTNFGIFGTAPTTQPAAYTRNAAIVEDRTLLASASATTLNNNNVLAALIADLQSLGVIG